MDREFWNAAYREDPGSVAVVDCILETELVHLSPARALDLGCGAGVNALKLAAQGWSTLGVDWSERAIELAVQAAREQNLNARFVVADITVWQPDEEFDLVVNTYALPAGDAGRQVLAIAAAALAPGATLIIADWDRTMAERWPFAPEELWTPDEIVAVLPPLEIEAAEVRRYEGMFDASDDPRSRPGNAANVAFVRARRPLPPVDREAR